ncbi:hypothetical protein AMS68_000542 [Peltaster fructicola]|uniref:Rhodopsin domain-containing protein n=1 Tax=Peltaster fructicola TaxID=286661 RepID=A0A6H0XK78_9PEZI|nr:hypothetical protein AMS68_000542 [Peltaster fructicola]
MPGNLHTVTFEEIAAWPTPNYVDPPDARTWLPGFAIFWCILASLFVIARIYLRIRNLAGGFGLDDVFLIIGWIFAIVFTAVACYAWIAQVIFIHATCATKVAVLLFYRRMTKSTYNPIWRQTCMVLLVITIAIWVAIFLVYCFMCFPLDTYWEIHILEAGGVTDFKCLNGDALTIVVGVITIASDLYAAVFPVAMFHFHSHELNITKRQRIALNVIFCLGLSVTGVGIARTYYLWEIGQNEDLSWIGYDLFVTSQVECQLALICTCAPSLRVLVRRYLPDRTATARSQGTDGSNNNRSWRASIWTVRGSTFQPTRPISHAPTEIAMSPNRGDKWQKIETLEQHNYT